MNLINIFYLTIATFFGDLHKVKSLIPYFMKFKFFKNIFLSINSSNRSGAVTIKKGRSPVKTGLGGGDGPATLFNILS